MNSKFYNTTLPWVISVFFSLTSCGLSKSPEARVPELTTSPITNLRTTGATSGGTVTNDGGAPVTSRGVCWRPFHLPTATDDSSTDGAGTGLFTSEINDLQTGSGYTYFVRAFAINSSGIGYGNELTFSILGVSIELVQDYNITTATVFGNVGGDTEVISRGVCWSTQHNPTVESSKLDLGSGVGLLIKGDITGLETETTYFVRFYATSKDGTFYSEEVTLTTHS